MGYDRIFLRPYRIIKPVVVHKRERIHGEFRYVYHTGFRRFEGGYI